MAVGRETGTSVKKGPMKENWGGGGSEDNPTNQQATRNFTHVPKDRTNQSSDGFLRLGSSDPTRFGSV